MQLNSIVTARQPAIEANAVMSAPSEAHLRIARDVRDKHRLGGFQVQH